MLVVRLPRSMAAALAACALALGAAGCGGSGEASEEPVRGTRLVVYASAPLSGPDRRAGVDVVRGQRLALRQHGGRIGRYRVELIALDAAAPMPDGLDPAQVSDNARRAADDVRAVAYLGETRTGSSAVAIPILNEAGLLTVSPLDTALGLTTRTAAIAGSPERYYPSAERSGRTFARLVPSDRVQAAAQLRAMADAGVRRLALLTDEDAPGLALADAVRGAARTYGIAIVGEEQVAVHAREHAELAERVLERRPDAVLYAGGVRLAAARVWRDLGAAAPGLRLYAPGWLASAAFLARAGASAASTWVTRPLLALRAYPPSALRFARAFATRYGARPALEALYGYEAMRAVLDALALAVREAGGEPLARGDVARAFFSGDRRDGVLGRFRIDANGDTSLRRWGLYRIEAGRLRFARAVAG